MKDSTCYVDYHEAKATLRTATLLSKCSTGVRIGDLLDGLDAVGAYAQRMGWNWDGHARFDSYHVGKGWEALQPAAGKCAFEIRTWRSEYEDDDISD